MTTLAKPTSPPHALIIGGTDIPPATTTLERQLLVALRTVVTSLGRRPSEGEVDGLCRYRSETYVQYFGSVEGALDILHVPRLPTPRVASAKEELAQLLQGYHESVPPQISKRTKDAELRRTGLAVVRREGVRPQTALEEALVFDGFGEQKRYLKLHPIRLQTVRDILAHHGSDGLIRMWEIWRQFHAAETMPERPTFLGVQLVWKRSARAKGSIDGPLKKIALCTDPLKLQNTEQSAGLVFKWSATEKRYMPHQVRRHPAAEMMKAFLHHYGVRVEHRVEVALFNYMLGYAGSSGHRGHDLSDYFRIHAHAAIGRLVAIARQIDSRFAAARLVRLAVYLHMPNGAYSGLQLDPWGASKSWDDAHSLTRLLFGYRNGMWRLLRYAGQYASDLVAAIDESSSGHVAPLRLKGQENVPMSWADLQKVMASPVLRMTLIQTLWQRDFPGRRLPVRYIFQARKNLARDDQHVTGMRVIGDEHGVVKRRDMGVAWLRFEHGAGARPRLVVIEGVGSGELAEQVLAGDGVILGAPLERVLVLRLLSQGSIMAGASGRDPVRLSELLDYFSRHGHEVPVRLAQLMHAVSPTFPEIPEHVALTGMQRDGPEPCVDGLTVKHGPGIAPHPTDKRYFWVQFDRLPDGHYRVNDRTRRHVGRQLADSTRGGQVIAPDADAIAKTAETLKPILDGVEPAPADVDRTPFFTPATPALTSKELSVPGRGVISWDRRDTTESFPMDPEDLGDLMRPRPSVGRLHDPRSPQPGEEQQDVEDPGLARMRGEIETAVQISSAVESAWSFVRGGIRAVRTGAAILDFSLGTAMGIFVVMPPTGYFERRYGMSNQL